MPRWGRPPGAKGSRRRRQWEQDQGHWQQSRVEELDSEGDTDTQGVGLHLGEKRFASDPLHFTGIDISSNTRPRRGYSYDEAERSSESDSEDSDYHDGGDKQLALRGDSEEAIVQGALARIRRAQEKGRQDVKLTQEELDALERRRIRMQAAAAAKAAKKGSSGSGAEKKRRSDRKTVDIASLMDPKPASDPKKRKSKRKSGSSSHSAAAGPGILVDGPDGPSYTPIGGYHPSDRGTSRSRSSARHGHSPQVRVDISLTACVLLPITTVLVVPYPKKKAGIPPIANGLLFLLNTMLLIPLITRLPLISHHPSRNSTHNHLLVVTIIPVLPTFLILPFDAVYHKAMLLLIGSLLIHPSDIELLRGEKEKSSLFLIVVKNPIQPMS
ncbi:prenylated rab acceptor 1 [Botrytis cinerea]